MLVAVEVSALDTELVHYFCILHVQPERHKDDAALDLVPGIQYLEYKSAPDMDIEFRDLHLFIFKIRSVKAKLSEISLVKL